MNMVFDEYPLTALSVRSDQEVVVGNTQGKMGLLDIRNKGKLIHTFKGFAGAIRSVHCHPTKPLVASCGLDRFLRVHNLNSKKMTNKVYLKSRLNCVLFAKEWQDSEEDKQEEVEEEIKVKTEVESDDDANDVDELWSKMEVVKTRTLKKDDFDKGGEKLVKRKDVQSIQSDKKRKKRKN